MNRWLGLFLVAALLVLAWIGYDRPDLIPGALDLPRAIYLVMALLLVSGAAYGFWRFRIDGGRALASILFWAALIVALTLGYAWVN
jgi:hypothetical protein